MRVSAVILILVLSFATFSVSAQEFCCVCTSPTGPYETSAVPDSNCSIVCGTYPGGKPDPLAKTNPRACKIQPTASLGESVGWSIWHQGANVWEGADNGTLMTGERLRLSLLGTQFTANGYKKLPGHGPIEAAEIHDIERLTRAAVNKCVTERDITIDIYWVWDHRALKWAMWKALQSNDFGHIRHMFSESQRHDDQLRNRIYCLSGPQIRSILERWGDPGPPPQPPKWEPNPDKGKPITVEGTAVLVDQSVISDLIARITALEKQVEALQLTIRSNSTTKE